MSDDLLHIYSLLRKLGYFARSSTQIEAHGPPFESDLFPRKFILKLIDERLGQIGKLAQIICDDLFKQIGNQSRTRVNPEKLTGFEIDTETYLAASGKRKHEPRYPEFDHYFHRCVHCIYDFIIEINWHEANIDVTGDKSELEARPESSTFSSNDFVNNGTPSIQQVTLTKNPVAQSKAKKNLTSYLPKSNLSKSIRTPKDEPISPTVRRRVRFHELSPVGELETEINTRMRLAAERDLQDVHSVFALEVLVYSIHQFIQKLSENLLGWSAEFTSTLDEYTQFVFSSRDKIRSQQLQTIAKRIKIFYDANLSVLDYLDEIKSVYLIESLLGTLCVMDNKRMLDLYKQPRVLAHVQKIGRDVELRILNRLIRQCLDIFFSILVSELNIPPVELDSATPSRTRAQQIKSQENIFNFVAGWLRIDDFLFGFARARPKARQLERVRMDALLSKIRPPKLATKATASTGKGGSSTLSSAGLYASSSRILAQMDNLSEFMREFLESMLSRLREQQQLKYVVESIYNGLNEAHRLIVPELEQQLDRSKNNSQSAASGADRAQTFDKGIRGRAHSSSDSNESIDLIAAKIRCLKFVHIMDSADKILRVQTECHKLIIDSKVSLEFNKNLATFAQKCTTRIVNKN